MDAKTLAAASLLAALLLKNRKPGLPAPENLTGTLGELKAAQDTGHAVFPSKAKDWSMYDAAIAIRDNVEEVRKFYDDNELLIEIAAYAIFGPEAALALKGVDFGSSFLEFIGLSDDASSLSSRAIKAVSDSLQGK
jgi:hypothetical protein